MEITDKKFSQIKELGEIIYKQIGEVYCPYFQEKIIFNAKGLEHLKFGRKNHARTQDDQYIRFKILPLAPKIISLSKTIQGISEERKLELERINNRNVEHIRQVTYYEFVGNSRKIARPSDIKTNRNWAEVFLEHCPILARE